VPLGVNMAVRRALIDRIGGFDPALGRRGGSPLGQEQAEFFCRSRDAARAASTCRDGAPPSRPGVAVDDPSFRRWWFWAWRSRASSSGTW
jgi:hypothetical protein